MESEQTETIDFQSFCKGIIQKSQRKQSTRNNLLGTLSTVRHFRVIRAWEDLNYTFLKDFEHWLRGKGYAVNTIAKHLRNLRTLTREAISAGVLTAESNPFQQFTIKQEKTPHRFLNPEELSTVENARLEGTMEQVRDAFLFCCYTGLRFSDFKQLLIFEFYFYMVLY